MTENITIVERPKISFEDEFWKRAASFNLNPGNTQLPSIKLEEIDEFLSGVMQKKMKLQCKVIGKAIFITLSHGKDT
jgi:hypothetical protein